MQISWEIVGIYIGMVIFGLFAYAVIIPYFTVRKFRKMLESGEGAQMICQLLQTPISVKGADGNPHETELANYLISLAIQNLKMQLNSFKSAMIRGIISPGADGEEGAGALDQLMEGIPKKWRWVAQLGLMVAGPKLAAMQQAQGQPGEAQAVGPAAPFKGG